MHRHELSDAEWKRIQALLPACSGPRSKRGDREFVNAVIWCVRTGVPWRDLPERFGAWKTTEELVEHARGKACIADSGYDSARLQEVIRAKGMKPVIAPNGMRAVKPRLDRNSTGCATGSSAAFTL